MSAAAVPPGWPASRPFEGSGWMTVAQAREAGGVRVTDNPHWANWWALSLRAVLDLKGIPFQKVLHPPFSDQNPDAQQELFAWTAQTSAPVLVYSDPKRGEIVKSDWLNQLLLAEQIEPEPALVPQRGEERVRMFGLAHEILSPQGMLWNGRLALAELGDAADPAKMSAKQRDFFTPGEPLGGKYSHNAKASAPLRNIPDTLALLDAELAANQTRGGVFFVGERLSALDLYWAFASNFVEILDREELPIMRFNRAMYPALNGALRDAASPRLMEHRERVLREHVGLPVSVD